jgi:predicted ATPase
VLTTSREPLWVEGEITRRVPSLAVPDLASTPHLDELARFPAVRLFVESARAVQHRFALTAENAPTVARICVHVDGLPLALELGAARVPSLTVGQIADRMDSSFRLLIGGQSDCAYTPANPQSDAGLEP